MEDYAIIIGVEHYEDSSFSHLKGATNDANDFKDWATDPNGGNIKAENCKLLLSNDGLTELFQKHIEDEASKLLTSAKADQENARRLYFYFSGHGLGVKLDEVALIPTDWKQMLGNRAIASKGYHDAILQYGIFEEVFFFLDCCRSRKVNIRPQGSALYSPGMSQNSKTTQSFVVFATQHWESAYESDLENEDDTRQNGFLTKALINGLKGEAALENGEITIQSLKGYLKSEVSKIADEHNKIQKPRFEHSFNDEATVISKVAIPADTTGEINTIIIFSDDTVGPFIILDKNLKVIGPWNKENGDWNLTLGSGLHLIKDQGSEKQMPIEIKRRANEVKNVTF